ncbi:MAG: DUF4007 family protein [Chloroflexi bacterium]|nr:DUF4007 family protein [Chloroflexota bacterium]
MATSESRYSKQERTKPQTVVSPSVKESSLSDLPFGKSFAGHETFPFRFGWLKKGVDAVQTTSNIFQRDEAIIRLGVGKNMVKSIRHWCLATAMVTENREVGVGHLQVTSLGRRLFADAGWDPFLEDDASLWLLHWKLTSSGTRAATWYWAFHRFREYAFTRPLMVESLARELQLIGWVDVSLSTIKRDIDCFVHTYMSNSNPGRQLNDSIDCPLAGLGILIQEPDSDRMRFRVGPKPSLPASIFAYALLEFWDSTDNKGKTLDFREIMAREGSPSLAFKLDQDSVLSYLDKLADVTAGRMIFEDTALVRRVVREGAKTDPMPFLEKYYGQK